MGRSMLKQADPSRSRAAYAPARAALLVVLHNRAHLAAAYGAGFAEAVMRSLQWQVREAGGLVTLADDTRFVFDPPPFKAIAASGYAPPPVEDWQIKLGTTPIYFEKQVALPVVSVQSMRVEQVRLLRGQVVYPDIQADEAAFEPPWMPASVTREGRERYQHDMSRAVAFYQALRRGECHGVFEPVARAGSSTGERLYQSARWGGAPIQTGALQEMAPTLAGLGLAQASERALALAVLDALEADSQARLGCRLSLPSLLVDAWWPTFIDRLATRPGLGERLTLELTDAIERDAHARVVALVTQLQSFGCALAVNALVRDTHQLAFLRALRDPVIKVEASLVHAARDGARGFEYLWRLTDLSKVVARHVVFEGVDTDSDVRVAYQAGAGWMQGRAVQGATEWQVSSGISM